MTRKAKALIFTLAGLLVLLSAVPWLIPVSVLIPSIEAEASQQLGQPVKLASLRFSLLPLPQVSASNVTLGEAPLASIGQISVRPNLRSLFSETRVLDEVRLERVWVKPEFLRRVAALRPSDPASPGLRVRRIVLKDAELRLERFSITALDGTLRLRADGEIQEIQLRHQGERLRIIATPDPGGFRLLISGRGWTPPAGPPVVFDRIEAAAHLTARGISTRALSADLYGGTLSGPLSVSWRPSWSIAGELDLNGLELQPLAQLLSSGAPVSGLLTAKPRFTLRARDPTKLLASLTLQSDFSVKHGVLQRVDLEAAARGPLARGATQGATHFERLAGHLEIDRHGYHFSRLEVTSGLLAATGQVSVSPEQRLDGWVDAQLTGTGPLLTVPLRVSGTVPDPSVLPTRTAVAGAVAGSVLLPGIGTAVGLKAGQLTEKLFKRRRSTEQGHSVAGRSGGRPIE